MTPPHTPRSPEGVTFKLGGILVANSRVTYRTMNDTCFIAGSEKSTIKEAMTSQVTTRQRGTSPFHSTVLSLLLYAHVKVPLVPFAAWYPSVQVTARSKKCNQVQTKSR